MALMEESSTQSNYNHWLRIVAIPAVMSIPLSAKSLKNSKEYLKENSKISKCLTYASTLVLKYVSKKADA